MPGEDPWDIDQREALEWLVSQMRGHSLWMDGTMDWSLPHSVLSGVRGRTALEAVTAAYARYKARYGQELRHG